MFLNIPTKILFILVQINRLQKRKPKEVKFFLNVT